MSYSKIPAEIKDSIGNFSRVSSRTAETIKRLSTKGDSYIKAILLKSKQLREGTIGANKLSSYVEDFVKYGDKKYKEDADRVISRDGRHLFTIRNDSNNSLSIHFPKDISNLLKNNVLDLKEFNKKIMSIIEDDMAKIK